MKILVAYEIDPFRVPEEQLPATTLSWAKAYLESKLPAGSPFTLTGLADLNKLTFR